MEKIKVPANEEKRLATLKAFKILDTPAEKEFDNITKLAAEIFEVPVSLISLLDENRQWFKSKAGTTLCETDREIAFCTHAILNNDIFIVEDTSKDKRFSQAPLVKGEPYIAFYAGMPITIDGNLNLGTLCLLDTKPRKLNPRQIEILKKLTKQVEYLITSRSYSKMMHEKITLKSDRFKDILEHSPDYIEQRDIHGNLVYANLAFRELTGLDTQYNKIKMSDIHSEDTLDKFENKIKPSILKNGYWKGEVDIIDSAKRIIPCSLVGFMYKLESEVDPLFTSVFRDIRDMTEMKRMVSELEMYAHLASHDLQTPLRHIKMLMEMLFGKLEKEGIDNSTKEMIDNIIKSAAHMQQLIKDLLEFSKAGDSALHFEEHNVTHILMEVTAVLKPLINEKKAKITIENMPTIVCDKIKLKQVFSNLMQNALKYVDKNTQPEISISALNKSKFWEFCIKDNGSGIPLNKELEIFDPFKRFNTSKEQEGSGVGLAICSKICKAHGGKIWVDLNQKTGSEFHFLISKKLTKTVWT